MAYKIPRESWRMIEIIIRRYPENKAEYANIKEAILHNRKGSDEQPKGSRDKNPTEQMAIKIAENQRLKRLEREINAVESAYNVMMAEHQKVIRTRFWSYRHQNMTYFDMERCTSYRERQMHKIVSRFILNVGKNIGEL